MNWISTPESSTIAGFEYSTQDQVLTVEFKDGARYNYFDVPESIFEGMKGAVSKGQFLAQQLRGTYRYARL
jgi:hypothetical protein